MHQNVPSIGFDHAAYLLANRIVGSDGSADSDAAILGDLGSHKPDTADIDVPVLFGKSQFRGKVLAHNVAVQQGYWTAAHFQEFRE